MKRVGLLLMMAMLLAACGNKGPLYLPDDAPKDKRELKQ